LCLVVGYAVLFPLWKNVPRPVHPTLRLTWLIPIAIAAPFLALGMIGQIKTQIVLSADTDILSVQKTLLSYSISSKEYLFSEVRSIKVGTGTSACFSM
jgi:hypothetical protein